MPAAKGPPAKEATVFILDAFPTMNEPHPVVKQEGASASAKEDSGDCPTRLDCAKRALEGMLFDMIINANAGSLAAVIVCKTKETENHFVPKDLGEHETLDGFPYANLTELRHKELKHSPAGIDSMRKPDLALIREMWNVEPVKSMKRALAMKGDICDAICLAADCLHSMTNKKRFRRKIVLLTDAQHPIVLDMTQMLHIIDALRSMDEAPWGETPIHVLGLGFGGQKIEYEIPLDASSAIKQEDISPRKRVKLEDGADEEENENEEPIIPDQPPSSSNNNNDEEPIFYNSLQDREKLLASLTEKTGGSVVPIATMQELLDAKAGKRVRKASPRGSQFHLGPGLTIDVKTFKLLDQEAMPKIVQRVVSLNADGMPRQSEETGEEITEPVLRDYSFYLVKDNAGDGGGDEKEEKAEVEDMDKLESIDKEELIDAVRYGKDLIPYGAIEKAGLKFEHDCGYDDDTLNVGKQHIHILGYVERSEIPARFMVGAPYGISGGASRKACILVAAMAQSLDKANCVAVCSATFSTGGSSSLACLLPFDEPNRKELPPNRLVLFKLPFEDDVKLFPKPTFDDILEADAGDDDDDDISSDGKPKKSEICDNLVDSLMLPYDALRSEKIASPYHTSFNQTVLNRAVRETKGNDLVAVREDPNNIMRVPPEVLEHSKPVIDQFRKAFPLRKKKIFKVRRGNKATTYKAFLGEEN